MADYIFNVFLHTDKVELKSEYFYNLPPFYFSQNEFVSAKAEISVVDSLLSCRGANIYNATTAIGGTSTEVCYALLTMYNSALIVAAMNSKALAIASAIEYSTMTDVVYSRTYGLAHFD
jgi:hypothetical protein